MKIATDGSSLRNFEGEVGKGPIAWAWSREDGHWYTNGFIIGTNQQAELMAVLMALLMHPKEPLHIQADSKYAINTVEKWMYGWARNNWVKSDKAPVMNLDIIKPIYALMNQRGNKGVDFEWVKGHDANNTFPLNTQADLLANTKSNEIKDMLKQKIIMPSYYADSKDRSHNEVEHSYYKKIYLDRV
jgi:ribonuclease HI